MFIELKKLIDGEEHLEDVYLNVNYIIKVYEEYKLDNIIMCWIDYMNTENSIPVKGSIKEIKSKIKKVMGKFIKE